MSESNNVIFKTSTEKTIDTLLTWNKTDGTITANTDTVPIVPGTVYFTADGHIIYDLDQNNRIWMSKNAYSAIYAEDINNSTLDVNTATVYYGTCATRASTREKTVDCPGYLRKEGSVIFIKMTNAQTYNASSSNNVTLNINKTGPINLKYIGTTQALRYCWVAGEIISVIYDGTNYVMNEGGIATTTYYGVTKLATSATSTSTSLALTPAGLNNFISHFVNSAPIYSTSSLYEVGDMVRYNYNAYICNTAIETAEAWNANHWTIIPTIQEQINNKADKATTIAGYGITDAKINNGTITLGNNSITPLTSFTETDPTVPNWAKASTKPSYTWNEIQNKPNTFTPSTHTHTTTIATDEGTNQLTLAYNQKYKLTAGGTNFIFTMPEGYSHPTTTAVDATAIKVGKDSLGHVVLGTALTKSDVGLSNVTNHQQIHEVSWDSTNKKITKSKNGTASDVVSFSAGSGISLTAAAGGLTIEHSNSITSGTAGSNSNTSGTTISIPYVNYDSNGHITASGNRSHTISVSDLGLSSAMHFKGITTTEIEDGDLAKESYLGINNYAGHEENGDVIIYKNNEFVWTGTYWELLGSESSYKIKQTAISDPEANGNSTSFIATIAQDENGVITATKANLPISVSSLANNKLVYTDNNNKLYSGRHYADTEHVAICFANQPTANFYVNGTAQIDNLLTLYRSGSTESNLPAGILFSVKDTTLNTTYSNNQSSYIKVYHDHDSTTVDSNQNHVTLGTNMVISAGGNLYLGGGESSGALYNAQGSSNAKNTFLTADSGVYIYANCNAIANRVGVKIETTGSLVPQKAEQLNDNVQNLGALNNKWANAYINNIIGYPLSLKTKNKFIYLKGILNEEKEIGHFQLSENGYRALVLGVASSNEDLGDTPGRLFFYSGNGAASISAAKTSNWNNHVLPVNGGWLVTAGNGSTTGAGNITTPVYINSDGVATDLNYTIEKSVPANAEFTDKKVSQNLTTVNGWRKILLNGDTNNYSTNWANAVSAKTAEVYQSQYVSVNPYTGSLSAKNYYIRGSANSNNYITSNFVDNIYFMVKSTDLNSDVCALVLKGKTSSAETTVKPGADTIVDLGTSTDKWNNVYAKNFKGNADTATALQTAMIEISDVGSGLSHTNVIKTYFQRSSGSIPREKLLSFYSNAYSGYGAEYLGYYIPSGTYGSFIALHYNDNPKFIGISGGAYNEREFLMDSYASFLSEGHFAPKITNTYNLGTSSFQWKEIYGINIKSQHFQTQYEFTNSADITGSNVPGNNDLNWVTIFTSNPSDAFQPGAKVTTDLPPGNYLMCVQIENYVGGSDQPSIYFMEYLPWFTGLGLYSTDWPSDDGKAPFIGNHKFKYKIKYKSGYTQLMITHINRQAWTIYPNNLHIKMYYLGPYEEFHNSNI